MAQSVITPDQRAQLRAVSGKLLQLHKLLLDRQRSEYELSHGPIAHTGEFLNLVLDHPLFEWLRQLSGMIVEIDELIAPRSKGTAEEAVSAFDRARLMLIPAGDGPSFQSRYGKHIHSSPDVLFLHKEITALLANDLKE